MFGDWGHGICLLLATLYLIIREKKFASQVWSLVFYNLVNVPVSLLHYYYHKCTALFRLHSLGTYSTDLEESSTSVHILDVPKFHQLFSGKAPSYTLMFDLEYRNSET